MADVRHVDSHDGRAQSGQFREHVIHRRCDIWVHVVGGIATVETDAQARDSSTQFGTHGGHRVRQGRRVVGIGTGHRFEHDGGVFHRASHRPDVVHGGGQGEHAMAAHVAIRRLEPH